MRLIWVSVERSLSDHLWIAGFISIDKKSKMPLGRIFFCGRPSRTSDRWSRLFVREAILTCLAGLCLLNYAAPARAAQYRLKSWTVENGLPQNVIRGIAQTPDGYLWIA